jgi:hypothetical protein
MFLSGAKTLSQSYMKSGESCPFCPRIEFWRGTGQVKMKEQSKRRT